MAARRKPLSEKQINHFIADLDDSDDFSDLNDDTSSDDTDTSDNESEVDLFDEIPHSDLNFVNETIVLPASQSHSSDNQNTISQSEVPASTSTSQHDNCSSNTETVKQHPIQDNPCFDNPPQIPTITVCSRGRPVKNRLRGGARGGGRKGTKSGDTFDNTDTDDGTDEDPDYELPSKRGRGRGRGGRGSGAPNFGGNRGGRQGNRGRGNVCGRGRGRGRGVQNHARDINGSSSGEDDGDDDEANAPDIVWDNEARDARSFQFVGPSGIQMQPQDMTCPLETLKMFLTDEIIDFIVDFTNRYASMMKETPEIIQRMNSKKRSVFNLWNPIDRDELWAYIAVICIMGVINKPNIHMFWTKDGFFATPIFSRLMRRDRFEQIRKMLHFSDPENEDPENPLSKLCTFLDLLQQRFQVVYKPERNVAVDEYLSLWKGRLKFRVYIPNKRERYGVKIYMLCESSSAYLYSFIVYTGAGMEYADPGVVLPKDFETYPTYSKVVLSLMKGLFDKGHCVTLDNLYTEPYLLKALYEKTTDCFGTLRKKKGLPEDFWLWKPQKGVGIPPLIQFHDKKLMVMRWNDCYKTKSKKNSFDDVYMSHRGDCWYRQNLFPHKRGNQKTRCNQRLQQVNGRC